MPVKIARPKVVEEQAEITTLNTPPEPDTRSDPIGPHSKTFLASKTPPKALVKELATELLDAHNFLGHFYRLKYWLELGHKRHRIPELVKAGKVEQAKEIVVLFWDTYKKRMAVGKIARPDLYD